jgi:hypothetical protein
MADVVRPGDDFIGYDLVGDSWTTNTVDHLAYGQSKTTRDHENKRNKGPLVTKAPTILEACELPISLKGLFWFRG